MRARWIVGDGLIVLTAAFAAYLAVVMARRIDAVVLKATYASIFRYELVICAVFMLFALDVRFSLFTRLGPGALRAAGWGMRMAVILATAALLFLIGRIAVGSLIRTAAPARHAVVLGLALENGQPSGDLAARLDAAEAYLEENPEATLVLTGGNPDEAGRTEAAVMRDILAGRGVPEARMILEDRARTTKENFRNTARLIDPDEPIVLISSGYHMDRAVRTAKDAGFSEVLRLPAPSSALYYGANVMWEVVLELNELTFRR